MKINYMSEHHRIINDEFPKIIGNVEKAMKKQYQHYKFEIVSWVTHRELIRIDEEKESFLKLMIYRKTTPIFKLWYDGPTHSYNCSFTKDNYDIIFPIINSYSYIWDDVFIYNSGDNDSI